MKKNAVWNHEDVQPWLNIPPDACWTLTCLFIRTPSCHSISSICKLMTAALIRGDISSSRLYSGLQYTMTLFTPPICTKKGPRLFSKIRRPWQLWSVLAPTFLHCCYTTTRPRQTNKVAEWLRSQSGDMSSLLAAAKGTVKHLNTHTEKHRQCWLILRNDPPPFKIRLKSWVYIPQSVGLCTVITGTSSSRVSLLWSWLLGKFRK